MKRALSLLAPLLGTAVLLAGCSIPSIGGTGGTTAAQAARSDATPIATRPETRQCLASLGDAGARFTLLPDREFGSGCSNLGTVQLAALASDRGLLTVANIGPVTCPVSTAFAAWARYGVDRAAQQVLGTRLESIQTMGSYSCRNVAGTSRRSGHATGAAIDVAGFVLADGRRIMLTSGWNGSPQEREFLRLVHASACRRFGTVLGPDYNAAHRDHFHLEGVASGNSYCR